jgi:hypothetical protein
MTIQASYGQATHTRRYALSVVDALAVVLGTRGAFPPPLGEITCEIVARTAPSAQTLDPPLVLWTMRNASGFVILDGTFGVPGSPQMPLPSGTYDLRIRGPLYQDLVLPLDWPPPNDTVRVQADRLLLPGPAYPFPAITPAIPSTPASASNPPPRPHSRGFTLIRGSVLSPAGDGVAAATAELRNFVFTPHPPTPLRPWIPLRCDTRVTGDWAILLPDRLQFLNVGPTTTAAVTHDATIRITRPDAPVVELVVTIPLGTEVALPQTALRGYAFRRGRPVTDARVTTSVGSGESPVRPDGSWRFYFPLDLTDTSATVTVTTGAGETGSATTPVLQGKTLVVPTFEFA